MYKIPKSVLVIIYTKALDVLLIERADHPCFWQSVTGSCDFIDEPMIDVARREVFEETGILRQTSDFVDWHRVTEYEIYPHWRHRYAPNITHNQEYTFGLCLDARESITLNPREHLHYEWVNWREASERCFSMSNVEAIQALPMYIK